jgi:internalin A
VLHTHFDLKNCEALEQMPPLASLTALQALILRGCLSLKHLPRLVALTALQKFDLSGCEQLQQLPPLPSHQTLKVIG